MRNLFTHSTLGPTLLALTLGAAAGGCDQTPDANEGLDIPMTAVQSECREMSLGSIAPKAAIEALVPEGVHVKGLDDFGADFEGAEALGIVITRTLACDRVDIEVNGGTVTEVDVHMTHVGTPITPDGFPASPYSTDGVNAANFSNYTFGYYTDSETVLRGLVAANVPGAASAEISLTDAAAGDCLVERSVSVTGVDYGYTARGTVPDPSCADPDHPYIGNWWGLSGTDASVISTDIPGQAEARINPMETVIEMTAEAGSPFAALMGDAAFSADALGLIGHIPQQTTVIDLAGTWTPTED